MFDILIGRTTFETNIVLYKTIFVLIKGHRAMHGDQRSDTSMRPEERMSEAVRTLLRAMYVSHQEADVEETRLKLSVIERQILGLLLARPGLKTRELADYFAVQTTTMASILDRLGDADLIEKRPHLDDKRAVAVTLTTSGQAVIEGIRARDIENCRTVLEGLSVERQGQFVSDLEMMARQFSR